MSPSMKVVFGCGEDSKAGRRVISTPITFAAGNREENSLVTTPGPQPISRILSIGELVRGAWITLLLVTFRVRRACMFRRSCSMEVLGRS